LRAAGTFLLTSLSLQKALQEKTPSFGMRLPLVNTLSSRIIALLYVSEGAIIGPKSPEVMTHLIELNTNTTIEELLEIVGEKVPSATQVNLNEMCILGGVSDNSVFIILV
jgi:hypothetical protein